MGAGLHQAAIGAAQAHRTATDAVEAIDDLFIDAAHQHHLHHIHGVGAGDPQPLLKHRFDREAIEPLVDLRATAMHHHRLNANAGQKGHIAKHRITQVFANHGGSAVLDHHPATTKTLDIRKGLAEDLNPQNIRC